MLAVRRGPAYRPSRGRAGRGAGRPGKKGSKEWTDGRAGRDARPSGSGRRARPAGPRPSARQARRKAAPAQRAEADKAHADALKALVRCPGGLASQPPSTSYTRPCARRRYPATSTGRRLAFARWIADRSNPLTARVAVNHLWGRHFGRAIVPSVNDFGRNGQRPSHPALLDWLAAELMDRGWSMKAIHRLIVTSATYRQDSRPEPADLARDPDNVFLWRWTPRRAEAEVVRDCVFAVAGTASTRRMGGPDIDHQGRPDRPPAEPVLPARRREADGVPPDLRRRRGDRVLPTQGQHPAPAGPGAGQQRPVAAPWPAGSPGRSRTGPAPTRRVSSRPHLNGCSRGRRPTPNGPSACDTSVSRMAARSRRPDASDPTASSRPDPALRSESLVHVL